MANNTAYYILRLMETAGVGIVKTNSILNAEGHNIEPNQLHNVLDQQQLESYQANEEKVHNDWQKLEENNVRCITILDEDYPEQLKDRLRKKAPPLLMVLGNDNLLKKNSAGFCGSRKASEKGIATAKDCADQLAGADINVVSGYAAGVDMATHQAALECGGTTTMVLCEGILHFKIKRALKELWDWDRIAVVSEFLPGVPWSVRNAMQRNSTICALTSSMILIESSSKGGSIEAGRACLKMGIPLFAPVYQDMPDTAVGNRELLKQGALELYKNKTTNRANMASVFDAIKHRGTKNQSTIFKDKPYHTERPKDQMILFDKKGKYKTG